jgi:hypothetical protein
MIPSIQHTASRFRLWAFNMICKYPTSEVAEHLRAKLHVLFEVGRLVSQIDREDT